MDVNMTLYVVVLVDLDTYSIETVGAFHDLNTAKIVMFDLQREEQGNVKIQVDKVVVLT